MGSLTVACCLSVAQAEASVHGPGTIDGGGSIELTLTSIQNADLSVCDKDPELGMMVEICGQEDVRPYTIECRNLGRVGPFVAKTNQPAQEMSLGINISKEMWNKHVTELKDKFRVVSVLTSLYPIGASRRNGFCGFFTNKDATLKALSTKTTFIDVAHFEAMINKAADSEYAIRFYSEYNWGKYNEHYPERKTPFRVDGLVRVRSLYK